MYRGPGLELAVMTGIFLPRERCQCLGPVSLAVRSAGHS